MSPPAPPESELDVTSNLNERRWFGDDDSLVPHQIAAQSEVARVANLVGLRPLPQIARHALAILGSIAPSRKRLVALIRQDLSLATKILRYAGTVHHQSGPLRSLDDAIARVGRKMLPGLVAAAATDAPFPDPDGSLLALVRHSLGTATLARELGALGKLSDLDAVYTCGLLHDVGRVLKYQCGLPAPDDPAVELSQDGFDHAILGAEIVAGWNVAPEVHRVISLHHHPGRGFRASGEVPARIGVIELADRIDAILDRDGDVSELAAALSACAFAPYIGVETARIHAAWPRLRQARIDALAAYPVRPADARLPDGTR